jgi:hypothetical protein
MPRVRAFDHIVFNLRMRKRVRLGMQTSSDDAGDPRVDVRHLGPH